MKEIFEEINALKAAYDKKINEDGERAFKESFKQLFAENPDLKTIWWTQYTPYWNDGDATYFSVNEPYIELISTHGKDENIEIDNDDEDDDDYDEEDEITIWGLINSDIPAHQKIGNALSELIDIIDSNIYEIVFGDHVKVVATRDGFVVSDYEHD